MIQIFIAVGMFQPIIKGKAGNEGYGKHLRSGISMDAIREYGYKIKPTKLN
jgi:hypothetical protein